MHNNNFCNTTARKHAWLPNDHKMQRIPHILWTQHNLSTVKLPEKKDTSKRLNMDCERPKKVYKLTEQGKAS
jgi:hypothetical protein